MLKMQLSILFYSLPCENGHLTVPPSIVLSVSHTFFVHIHMQAFKLINFQLLKSLEGRIMPASMRIILQPA